MDTLRVVGPDEVQSLQLDPVDPVARDQAAAIIAEVRQKGAAGLIEVAHRLRDIESLNAQIYFSREDLRKAFDTLDAATQQVLHNTAERIRAFAVQQRSSIVDMTTTIPGGRAGHTIAPVDTAGCYAPGGRYPLPSSVLMTAITARAAGVKTVYVASPRPALATLAAAYVADADGLLAVGGAQAIAAMAYGIAPLASCDVIVGPGNKWVTAAKSLVSGICAIDMLAGPSEVLVIADATSDADVIAADLLAQAEHDTEARPILVSTSAAKITEVNECLARRLATLPTAETAREAVAKGFAVLCEDNLDRAIAISDLIGPEHLEVHTVDAEAVAKRCNHYGAVFIGKGSAEVLGDYGAGPNHVLPTCGTARYTGGLSVFTFLRIRTWMQLDNMVEAQALVKDCVALARVEGLEGHAQSAECRLLPSK